MIKEYIFGNPFETESVVNLPKNVQIFKNDLKSFEFGKIEINSSFKCTINLDSEDKIFGLGEQTGGINKRGKIYKSWCTDDPCQTEEKESLYGAHNFIVIYSPYKKTCSAFYFDYPGKLTFDICFTFENKLIISCDIPSLKIFEITPDSENISKIKNYSVLKDVVFQFRTIIGKSYIPGFWAFGYLQSRWGYKSEKDLNEIYENHKKNGLPIDGIFLDIEYMKDYRDFTISKENFPDFKKTIQSLKEKNIHVIPIIDAGIKDCKEDSVDQEGLEKDYFVKRKDGSVFKGAVWPGIAHFPDFMQKDVRKWFGENYKILTDSGIDGFWNDMNEPAIFYSDSGLKNLCNTLSDVIKNIETTQNPTWQMKDAVLNVQNSNEDYSSFYHQVEKNVAGDFVDFEKDGKSYVNHSKIHNLYGYNMTRSAGEYLNKILPQKNLLISRASYIGMHRYSGIWTGDNSAWWSHIELCIKQLPSLNMCGFLYVGCDLGGFNCNTSRELLIRFLQLGVFTPLMRNHACIGTRNQELYAFENVEDFKSILLSHYRLIPYLYKEFVRCAEENDSFFKPLAFEFPEDKIALETEDELLLSNEILICPVYKPNQSGRVVYLPEDMKLVRMNLQNSENNEIPEIVPYKKGFHYINYGLNEVVFFLRNNSSIELVPSALSTAELNSKETVEIK